MALALTACAGLAPPRIEIAVPDRVFISPANQDGIQDTLNIPVSLIPDEKTAILGYAITVKDMKGNVAWSMERSVPNNKKSLLENLLLDLRLKRRTGVDGLEFVLWEGKDSSGALVPDGEYRLYLEAWDNKNRATSPDISVVVDNTPPSATLSATYTIFSPNGDGNKDFISIAQSTSSELSWTGSIVNAKGTTLRSWAWSGQAEAALNWDGKDQSNKVQADGLYTYSLRGSDRAGNYFETALPNIAINTASTPFFIGLSGRAFSPNGDGVRDKLLIQPVMESIQGVSSWTIQILTSVGEVVFNSEQKTIKPFEWLGVDNKGMPLAEGLYRVALTVTFENGNAPRRVSDPISLDLTPAKARVRSNYLVFSPDGDGARDTIKFMVSGASEEEEWKAEILDIEYGTIVYMAKWEGLPSDFEWDGRDSTGTTAPDGIYVYRLSSVDPAGNEFAVKSEVFTLDAKETPIALRVEASGFSPNGDGVKDLISFGVNLPIAQGVVEWILSFEDEKGIEVKRYSGSDVPADFASAQWDGRTDQGSLAADGLYRARLRVRYEKGNIAMAESSRFALDITPPSGSISLTPLPFSPDGDGQNDKLSIRIIPREANSISDWEMTIRDREGNMVTRFSALGAPVDPIEWNGLSSSGELVLSAEDYPVEAIVRDQYGNAGRMSAIIPVDILVIKEGNRYRIRVPGIYFAPFSAEFPRDKLQSNMNTLRKLAQTLQKYPAYVIRVEGNAVRINWADKQKGEAEERSVLGPLSEARAAKVREILISLGIDATRLTVAGLGGTAPLVAHSDLDNRWKNRRVDFVLIKR
jgi:flagellar hook assembly protein FlgD/outer membrane protein OmpA-like peptidoglycan-associated protein